mgnify:CR=1 FL=1
MRTTEKLQVRLLLSNRIHKVNSKKTLILAYFYSMRFLKILDKENQLLDENTIKKCLSESSYFENKTIGHLGLSKLQNIYRISFSGESCGVPKFHYYFGQQ